MIANLRETTRANEEQDWLKTNLARITGLVQGRRDLSDVTDVIMRELTPSVAAQHGAFFLAEGVQAEARAAAGGDVRLQRRGPTCPRLPLRRGAGRPGREGAPADPHPRGAGRLHPGRLRPRWRDARSASWCCRCRSRTGCSASSSWRRDAVHRGAPRVPRPADGADRRLAQRDPGQLPDRGAAGRVAAAGHRAAGEAGRAAVAAGGARGAGRAALAVEPLQVRVPGQHEPRAADAAEQPADPGPAAHREQRRQPQRQAGGVRPHHPQLGHRPAAAHQRHPRPVQGRGREDGRARRRGVADPHRRLRRGDLPAAHHGPGARRSS